MTSPGISNGVVIGYGSIGRVHAQLLASEMERVAVVDFAKGAQEAARDDNPTYEVFGDLTDLEATTWPISSSLFVIATWGPSHYDDFRRVVALGGRRILCEKPIADSIGRASEMVVRAASEDVALGVNFSRRYGGQAQSIRALAERFDVGEPTSIVVHGGARGVVTNGIHLIDLACDIFAAEPDAVVSTVVSGPPNPRSPDLGFYGGTCVFAFPSGGEMTLSLSQHSRLKESIFVYFRDAVLVIDDRLQARFSRIPQEHTTKNPAITWTGSGSEPLYTGDLPDVLAAEESIRAAHNAVRNAVAYEIRPGDHLRSLSACIGALLAGESGHIVRLPIDPDSPEGIRRWPIS